MDFETILRLAVSGDLSTVEGIDPSTAKLVAATQLTIGQLCPLKIYRVSTVLDRAQDVAILDDVGDLIATICFTAGLEVPDPNLLTKWRYVAYLSELDGADLGHSQTFRFRLDYVVVDEERLNDYLENYKEGAPVWGSFSHEDIDLSAYQRPQGDIQAKSGILVPTDHHQEALQRHLNSNNSFDRFLRLYHSIELLFDFVILRKIQNLDNDLVGYAEIMKEMGNNSEVDRLKLLINDYCSDHNSIGRIMNIAASYEDVCRKIFQEYSKNSNPLKDDKFDKFWPLVSGEKVSEVNVLAVNAFKKVSAHTFISSIAAYWIYRIRCSIAHNRVGEFILMDDHDDFVGEFGVQLLQCVVEQIFSNSEFKNLSPTT